MANPTVSLDKYSNAVNAMKAHQESNQAVFDEHKRLVLKIIDAENELRDAVAESKEGVENLYHKVTVTPQTQTFADVEEVDKALGAGYISQSVRDRIVKTVQRPEKISITEQK